MCFCAAAALRWLSTERQQRFECQRDAAHDWRYLYWRYLHSYHAWHVHHYSSCSWAKPQDRRASQAGLQGLWFCWCNRMQHEELYMCTGIKGCSPPLFNPNNFRFETVMSCLSCPAWTISEEPRTVLSDFLENLWLHMTPDYTIVLDKAAERRSSKTSGSKRCRKQG